MPKENPFEVSKLPEIQVGGVQISDRRRQIEGYIGNITSDFLAIQTEDQHIILINIDYASDRETPNYQKSFEKAVKKTQKISNATSIAIYSFPRAFIKPKLHGLGLDLNGRPVKYTIDEFNKDHDCSSPESFFLDSYKPKTSSG